MLDIVGEGVKVLTLDAWTDEGALSIDAMGGIWGRIFAELLCLG
jgi:hypothetical protein